MDERWLLPHTKDFYVRAEDIRDVTWEENNPGRDADGFSVRVTFVHPSIASQSFTDYTWTEIVGFAKRGVAVRKAVPS